MNQEMTLTYQTRLKLEEEAILTEYACLFNRVMHALYAEMARGRTCSSCKNDFLKKYGITARQFNAVKMSLEGKVDACKAGQKQAILSLEQQIEALSKKIKTLEKKPSKYFILHQKKRRFYNLSHRLSSLQTDHKNGGVRLCFGGKKLFKAQFHLKNNGFSCHQEWKKVWEFKRQNEFFVLGSKDETAGNQSCQLMLQENGKLSLRLRLPHILAEKYGKYFIINNLYFAYGQEAILKALKSGQAISYRFKKDEKGFRVFVSTDLKKVEPLSKEDMGAIGIDLNTDHIACVETDRFGNPIQRKVIPYVSYGKKNRQLKALTGDICKEIVNLAKEKNKPLVIEKLDFKKKKSSLAEDNHPRFARLLSGFAYGLFFKFLKARAFKNGITVHQINPAFTSLIGRIIYAKRYGLSVHLSAALCIARRHQKFSETPRSSIRQVLDGKKSHVAFVLPARNRTKHVWHFWGQVKRKLKAALAAHFRATCIS